LSTKELKSMKKMLVAVALGAAILGSEAGGQTAQPTVPAGPGAQVAPRAAGPMHGRMQGDRTRQQAQQMAVDMFQRYDVNGDGVVTREEAQQALAQVAAKRGEAGDAEQAGGRAQRMLARMFGDAASVTIAQFEGQALARFDREDSNRDGVVTQAERQQRWANRGQ
jgi:hypothetical protein